MKVERVEYSRLFNLPNYQNERIGFSVVVEDNDNPEEVLGKLFFKIERIKEKFDLYRDLKEAFTRLSRELDDLMKERVFVMKKIKELEDAIEQEKHSASPNACTIQNLSESLENQKDRLQEIEKEIKDTKAKVFKLEKLIEEVKNDILEGKFEEGDL